MSDLAADLVRRVEALDRRLRLLEANDRPFGNARLLGGFHADGPASFTTTSGSYVDLGGADYTRITVAKLLEDTSLVVAFTVGGFASTATATVEVGVQVDTTDFASRPFRFNETSEHHGWADMVAVPGIAAGDRGVELRVRRSAGTGTFEISAVDGLSYLVWETPSALAFT